MTVKSLVLIKLMLLWLFSKWKCFKEKGLWPAEGQYEDRRGLDPIRMLRGHLHNLLCLPWGSSSTEVLRSLPLHSYCYCRSSDPTPQHLLPVHSSFLISLPHVLPLSRPLSKFAVRIIFLKWFGPVASLLKVLKYPLIASRIHLHSWIRHTDSARPCPALLPTH